uniref:Uncharacterized protein n=1 Tax=Panagrolaimus sp. PS1159 TaxID=55785 RepID=A0AC35G5X3_9BILA
MTTVVAEEKKTSENPSPVAQEQGMQNIVAENSTAEADTVTTAEKEEPVKIPSENVAAVKASTEPIISNETLPQSVATAATVETQRSVSNETTQNQQASTPATSSSSSSAAANPSFYQTFDEFFKNFLDSEPSQLDDREIRVFTNNVPQSFIVPVDQYHILYKALFKIKEIQDKAIFNDSLALIKKIFHNSDFNKFILGFWNCDEIKNRELGPIGFSFTDGKHKCDFSDVRPHDDISSKNVKVLECAWSMILDVEATLEYLINEFVENKPMSVYYAIILRRFSCCGDYKIKLDGKELPIFIYVFRKAHDRAVASGHLLLTTLSCLNTVTWRPRSGFHCSSLMKPNYALCETMNYLLRDDENQSKYLQNLERLFNPIDKFRCTIEWNSTDSTDFDNPTIFLYHFIKYFNRKNPVAMNDTVFYIIECFKKSLHECSGRISNFDLFEEGHEIDWPFAYCILEFLEFRSLKRHIPESIYKSLPENVAEKFISLNEEEPSREKALTGIFELFLLCRTSRGIPDAFYKNLLSNYGGPKSVIDIVAKCILEAINNLKNSAKIEIDMKFVDFVARVCEYSLDSKLFEQFSGLFEMDTD